MKKLMRNNINLIIYMGNTNSTNEKIRDFFNDSKLRNLGI